MCRSIVMIDVHWDYLIRIHFATWAILENLYANLPFCRFFKTKIAYQVDLDEDKREAELSK